MVDIDWTKNDHNEEYDVILGCEVVFRLALVKPLIQTIHRCLKSGGKLYLLSSSDRSGFLLVFHMLMNLGYNISTSGTKYILFLLYK